MRLTRLAAACVLFLANRSTLADTTCFGAADRPTVPVWMQGPPPVYDGQAGYAYYPTTVAATVQVDKLRASRSSVQGAYWQWANHGPRTQDGNAKGNITPGSPGVQIRFSTIDAANACTLAQTAAVLGLNAYPYVRSAPLTVTTQSQSADTQNICILQPSPMPAGEAVVLDYEVQDGRTAAQTLSFLTEWAALVHSSRRQAVLYPNALDAPTQVWTQLTPVAKQAAAQFDLVHIWLWSQNAQRNIARSFAVQQPLYGVVASKLLIAFELAGTTMDDARTVRGLLTSGQAAGVNFWRNGAEQGGSCASDVNRKIACVALGRC